MSYDPLAIANSLIDTADRHGQAVDHMKLQKLVYFTYGWNLAIKRERLFEETIKAWPYGPVIPSVYREFCRFGSGPIRVKAMQVDYERMGEVSSGETTPMWIPSLDDDPSLSAFTNDLILKMWERYGCLSGIQLSAMTHEPGTPWDQILKQYNGHLPRNVGIPDPLIRDYFLGLARPKMSAS